MSKHDLIQMVIWLLERLDTRQICRVLSLANRIFVTETPPEK